MSNSAKMAPRSDRSVTSNAPTAKHDGDPGNNYGLRSIEKKISVTGRDAACTGDRI